jgi:hypothetical protein
VSPALILALAFIAVCVVVGAMLSVRLWRGEEKVARMLETGFAATPFGPDVKRGMVRGIVPLIMSLMSIGAAVLFAVAGMKDWHGGTKLTPLIITACSFFALYVICFVLHFCIIYFNKPIWLVPPFMRRELGMFKGRRQAMDIEQQPSTRSRTAIRRDSRSRQGSRKS